MTLARRMINLEQQRKVQGNKVYGGSQTQLPLMLNQAGVIPVIFAQPVMVVLMTVGMPLPSADTLDWLACLLMVSQCIAGLLTAFIVFFTFFYISITVDLNEWANNFKQNGFLYSWCSSWGENC